MPPPSRNKPELSGTRQPRFRLWRGRAQSGGRFCRLWPGGALGGIEWGTATDGQRIYVAIANNGHLPYTLVPTGQRITWGSWSALDVATGKILWQTADPTAGTIDPGSVSVANGVMYA